MKKKYEKPFIYVEQFHLSHSVASACSIVVNSTASTCSLPIGGGTPFTVFSTGVCTFTLDQYISGIDKMCYHIPVKASSIFSS